MDWIKSRSNFCNDKHSTITYIQYRHNVWNFGKKYFPTVLPLPGSGQDNDIGPTILVISSAIVLIIMRDEGCDLDVLFYLSQLDLIIAGFEFVNDTYIINVVKSVNTKGE